MPALHIRNIPEETVAVLKERAARHGRSLEAELRHILDQTAASSASDATGSILDRVVTVHSGRAAPFSRQDIYNDKDPDGR